MAPFNALEVVFSIAECGLSIAASETQVWIDHVSFENLIKFICTLPRKMHVHSHVQIFHKISGDFLDSLKCILEFLRGLKD